MNERIKELWLKAAREDSGDKWDSQEEFIERFSMLIVRECANRATWAQDTGEKDIGGEVLKHFGFEVPPKTIKVIKI